MTDEELAANQALTNGKLDLLANILSREEPDVHPILQRTLVKLIRGDVTQTDLRLLADKHPKLKSMKQGRRAQLALEGRQVATAMIMATNGALHPGNIESAVAATEERTGMNRATILRHWSAQKDFLIFCAKRGHFDPS